MRLAPRLPSSIAAALAALAAFAASEPGDIEGLRAWYRADALGLRGGEEVEVWEDSSGNGHHLTSDHKGVNGVYNPDQVNEWPAVLVGAGNSYSVNDPFDLASHTIFLVYKASGARKALLRSEASEYHGVTLRDEGKRDQYQDGGLLPHQVKPYGTATAPAGEYAVSVLARDADSLRSFVNGRDVSALTEFPSVIRVGVFFHLRHTRAAASWGDGLSIAEMLFYDRYLTDGERAAVTGHLASKYAVDVEAVPEGQGAGDVAYFGNLAQLSTSAPLDVNGPDVPVPWDAEDHLEFPFEHDAKAHPTRLECTLDGTRVRLFVSLPLTSETKGANVRALFRVNGKRVLRGVGASGPIGPGGASVRAEVFTVLDAGDWVEVLIRRAGAPGRVTIEPGMAVFIAEVR